MSVFLERGYSLPFLSVFIYIGNFRIIFLFLYLVYCVLPFCSIFYTYCQNKHTEKEMNN